MKTKYTKMHSNGNEFLITDDIRQVAKIKALGNKKNGLGFDQLLYIKNQEPFEISVFNSDGSEADNCINGLRCIAYLYGLKHEEILIKDNKFIVDSDEKGATVTGSLPHVKKHNDHYIIKFGNNHIAKEHNDINLIDLEDEYLKLKSSKKFKEVPNFNLSVFQISEDQIGIRTYENGAGETLSCGSATISVAYALLKDTNKNELLFTSRGGKTKVYKDEISISSKADAVILEQGYLNE
jgi:diaminopimelate epimerase